MKRQIIILGAAYFAREVYSMVMDCIAAGKDWEFKGFLDNRTYLLDDFPYTGKMLGAVEDYAPEENDYIIPALGDPAIREKYVAILKDKGAKFETLIHPTAYIGTGCEIGEGCIITQFDILTADVHLGNFVNVGSRTTLSHGNYLGDFVTFAGHCCVAGEVKIGRSAFVGCNVTIVPHVTIGDNAYLCAGSVVIRRVKENTRVIGNPAKRFDII